MRQRMKEEIKKITGNKNIFLNIRKRNVKRVWRDEEKLE